MSCPVLTVAEMRRWEQETWRSGITEAMVIEQVGCQLAAVAMRLSSRNDHILLLAGRGNNGADVLAARPFLTERHSETLQINGSDEDVGRLTQELAAKPAMVLDGLFGIGLNRPLSAQWNKVIEAVNASGVRVLSADVPSGLNADTGETFGAAIRANITLTVGAPKKGLLARAALPYVGRLEVADDVGLIPCPIESDLAWALPEDFAAFPPERPPGSHKGTHGHLVIVAGSRGYHGAAVLAASAAQRAKPGLITLFIHEPAYVPVASQLQSVMVSPWKDRIDLPENTSGLVIGPGLAAKDLPDDIQHFTEMQWREATFPVLVDASALQWLPKNTRPFTSPRLITPHPGEAARILQTDAEEVQDDRPRAARSLSQRLGNAGVVLKGHQTIAGHSTGALFINGSGNSGLGQGGSGDALSGFIGGLWAQPDLQKQGLQTIRYAVWEHGRAADRLEARRRNWTVEELIAELGAC